MTFTLFRTTAQYNCSSYGTSTYNNGQTCAAQTTNGGTLVNTGFDIIVPLAAGLLLIAVAVVLIVRNLRKRGSAASRG